MRVDRFAHLAVSWGQFQPLRNAAGEVTTTFCNRFVALCAAEVGCLDLGAVGELLADAQARRLSQLARAGLGWVELDAHAAAKEAGLYRLVVAAAPDPDGPGGRRGHVAIVVPGAPGWSKKHKRDMPMGANVGQECWFGRKMSYAFAPDMPPRFFSWSGPYPASAEVVPDVTVKRLAWPQDAPERLG